MASEKIELFPSDSNMYKYITGSVYLHNLYKQFNTSLINIHEEIEELKDKDYIVKIGDSSNPIFELINNFATIALINFKLTNAINKKDELMKIIDPKHEPMLYTYKTIIENIFSPSNFPRSFIPKNKTFKFEYSEDDTNSIYIVPGSSNVVQCYERIDTLIEVLKTVDNSKITYIILSGRGDANAIYKELEQLKKNQTPKGTSFLNNRVSNDRRNFTDILLPEDKFALTEASLMLQYLQTKYSDYDKIKDKIVLEPYAMETAANFVLSPFAVHKKFRKSMEDIITEFNNQSLHIITSDYHIYRCASLSMHMFRTKDSKTNVYIHNSVPIGREHPIAGHSMSPRPISIGDFSSLFQPYEQLFLDTCTPDINFHSNSIKQCRSDLRQNINDKHKSISFRLLVEHGYYNRYHVTSIKDWFSDLYKYYENLVEYCSGNIIPSAIANSGIPSDIANSGIKEGGGRGKLSRKKQNKKRRKTRKTK